MANNPIIRKGDSTDHDGIVVTAIENYKYDGIPVAGKGDLVSCPLCNGLFPIIEGSSNLNYMGKSIALEGMTTACGAKLISSQKALVAPK